MDSKTKNKLIRELLHNNEASFEDEEMLHLLIDEKVSINTNDSDEKESFGQKAADTVATFAGSWAFIFSFIGVMAIWMIINILLAVHAFDAYPFILLNLVLSCLAAVQAPLIMMSQNRQEAKDRKRAENDYRVNLKSELVIDDLHRKIDTIIEHQKKMEKELLELKNDKKM